MDKKGIAVPYIIALILGIVVVGVIGYWFFTTTGTGGASGTIAACSSKKVQWCNTWATFGYIGDGPVALGAWDTFARGCTEIGVSQPENRECRSLAGTLKSSGETCSIDGECISQSCLATQCPANFDPRGKQCVKTTDSTCSSGTLDTTTDKCKDASNTVTGDPNCATGTYNNVLNKCLETANPIKITCA